VQVAPSIVLVKAPSQRELGDTFLRFQEHYESPEWCGKVFTAGQIRAWYSEKYGADTYSEDWTGFNFPSHILDKFKQGLFDPVTAGEQELLDLFRRRNDKFYIIGAQNDEVLDHETCHGLYYTNNGYRAAVDKVLKVNHDELAPVRKVISGLMYHPSVIQDEVHAWVSSSLEELADLGVSPPMHVHKALRAIKEKFYKES
jgi:hypothetical protein